MNQTRGLFLSIALLGGCASAPPPENAGPNAGTQLECRRETPVGTMLPVTRCAPATTEAERQRAIGDMRQGIPPGGTKATPGTGG